jgi:phage tail protein X
VSLGDTIDTIAQSAYSDPTQWWKIADANPNIMLWDVLPNGTMLRIPNSGPAYVF